MISKLKLGRNRRDIANLSSVTTEGSDVSLDFGESRVDEFGDDEVRRRWMAVRKVAVPASSSTPDSFGAIQQYKEILDSLHVFYVCTLCGTECRGNVWEYPTDSDKCPTTALDLALRSAFLTPCDRHQWRLFPRGVLPSDWSQTSSMAPERFRICVRCCKKIRQLVRDIVSTQSLESGVASFNAVQFDTENCSAWRVRG